MNIRQSVCIVTGRRIPALVACLESLRQQVDPPTFEVLVCSDGDPDVAAAVLEVFPDATVCRVDRALPGAARNILIERARGDLLVFLDDDVTVEPDLLARYERLAREHPRVGVFGGPNETPLDSSRFQFVQGASLASIVGSGPVRRRYGAHPAGPADERFFILCNLAVRRSAMVPFDHRLVCAEENAVLAELRRRGVGMYYDPALIAYHERRPTWRGFLRQMHKYGRGRGQLARRDRSTVRAAFLVPAALVTAVAATPMVVAVAGPAGWGLVVVYVGAIAAGAAKIAATVRRPGDAPLAAALLVTIHAGYGTGVLRGLLERRHAVALPRPLEWFGAVSVAAPRPVQPLDIAS